MKVSVAHTEDRKLSLAIGSQQAVVSYKDAESLRSRITEELHLIGLHNKTTKDRVLDWYLNNPKQQAVDVMACLVLDMPLPNKVMPFDSNPWDYVALKGCISFVKAVPEVKQRFSDLAEYNPIWKAIINQWDCFVEWAEKAPEKGIVSFNRLLDLDDDAEDEDENAEWAAIEREEYNPSHRSD